ncbi:uncharacterized protein LY89DRAFT_674292 [Mollisia scopiformis]|uniref:Uncharacterized protein n=1 Tax=Mollisia scopiformis TaxID=149040 RepID=A0A194WVN2_MOLSC|nr:uncharacterized protein LY89DRAFT_674292 [Mollisia scopiformis]KUJ11729.1 hypothetical protein LY89DRAFT_674292 [Mollisia scopiformis]
MGSATPAGERYDRQMIYSAAQQGKEDMAWTKTAVTDRTGWRDAREFNGTRKYREFGLHDARWAGRVSSRDTAGEDVYSRRLVWSSLGPYSRMDYFGWWIVDGGSKWKDIAGPIALVWSFNAAAVPYRVLQQYSTTMSTTVLY